MTCYPLRFTCTSTKDTFTFIGRNFPSGESDECFIWWRKLRPTNNFAQYGTRGDCECLGVQAFDALTWLYRTCVVFNAPCIGIHWFQATPTFERCFEFWNIRSGFCLEQVFLCCKCGRGTTSKQRAFFLKNKIYAVWTKIQSRRSRRSKAIQGDPLKNVFRAQ